MLSITIQVDFNAILEQKSTSLVVAYFYTKGYDPCATVDEILTRAQKKYESVTFVYVDANDAQSLTEEHKVTTVPTCLFFKDKGIVDRFQGVDEEEIGKLIEKYAVTTESQTPSDESSDAKDEESAPTPAADPESFHFSDGFLPGLWNPEALKNLNPSYLPPKPLIDDIQSQLSIAFGSAAQRRAARSDKDKPIAEPSLTFYCPLEGGEYVVDATVQNLAERLTADVHMLDISQLATTQWSNVWKDIIKPQDPPQDSGCSCSSCRSSRSGRVYFSASSAPDAEKLKPLAKQLFDLDSFKTCDKANESDKRRRIIYIRDFGLVATLAPALYHAILVTVQKTLPGSEVDGIDPVPTVIIQGTSPFLNKSGLFQEGNSDIASKTWDESSDAQETREKRTKSQYEMWKSGSLSKHIESHLSETKVYSDISGSGNSRYKYSRICIVAPTTRDLAKERTTREKRRLDINQLQVRLALHAEGAELSIGPDESQEEVGGFTEQCRHNILTTDEIHPLVDRAIGMAAEDDITQDSKVPVNWDTLCNAWETQKAVDEERSKLIKDSTKEAGDQGKVDDLVEKVKEMDLSRYEKDMLRCLIKPDQLQTTFDTVHLPTETIDVVRSLVSLPLLCPDAFQTGLLKEYNMTGALFFGPPGTGKTHLARAIAKESGARMLSVKPSDIMDKYVGESEKIISGLFQLARRLKPCIVFIDEVDSLFGARTSKSNSPWRADMLTQFAQEMDGMHTSDVVVIGTTNRPFDLDDAMVRRLPCRILVELPDEEAREAILKILLRKEQLESDVDLKSLARQTSRYSGSDLKSLCVMAAYESAKESTNVPWNTSVSKVDTSPSSKPSFLGTLTPSPTDSGRQSPAGANGDTSNVVTSDAQESEPAASTPKGRTLTKRHFTHALAQVRASTSESQESFVQLRKWNEQFGSANQRKKVETKGPPNSTIPRPYTEHGSYLRQLGVI